MTDPLRLFILAGEASGDRIGADLVARLRDTGPVDLTGVGGAELAELRLQSLFPMSDLSVMGFEDVVRRLPLLLWRVQQTTRAVLRTRPDVAVFIDAQVFSEAVARRVRRAAPDQRMVLYVAPSVWAWKRERAPRLKPLFNEILGVLPFEPAAMARLGGPPTSYVGHPALARFPMRTTQAEQGPLLLLPGSRRGELRRHFALFRDLAAALAAHPRVTGLVLPTLASLADQVQAEVMTWSVPVKVVTGLDRLSAFSSAVGALAVSGTVTLELALSGIPMVVVYVGDRLQARHYARLGEQPIALPNIIAGERIVPELLFVKPDARAATNALETLLGDSNAIARQLGAFERIRGLMEQGTADAPRSDPAERVRAVAGQRLSIGK